MQLGKHTASVQNRLLSATVIGQMETGALSNPARYHSEITYRINRQVSWTEPGLRITRLRLVSDPGFPAWDVSYCHGRIGDEPVEVQLPFSQLLKQMRHPQRKSLAAQIVDYAKRDKVSAKRLGILSAISTLN